MKEKQKCAEYQRRFVTFCLNDMKDKYFTSIMKATSQDELAQFQVYNQALMDYEDGRLRINPNNDVMDELELLVPSDRKNATIVIVI